MVNGETRAIETINAPPQNLPRNASGNRIQSSAQLKKAIIFSDLIGKLEVLRVTCESKLTA